MKKYFYSLLCRYLSLYIQPQDRCWFIGKSDALFEKTFQTVESSFEQGNGQELDYIVTNGQVHYEEDVQGMLEKVHRQCAPATRLIVLYYSSLWRPLLQLATFFGLRNRLPEDNWVSHEDMANFLLLSNFEMIRVDGKILFPIYIPIISEFINRFVAPLPFFRMLTMVNILVARPIYKEETGEAPSVSVIVPARNEAGNIEQIIHRTPKMGPKDELIFVEGNSTDDTWAVITQMAERYGDTHNVKIARQDGKGKGDAVRKGFALARNEILMILDADMTVPPEELPKFYQAIASGKGEFINGSRLVYPMEKEAMRFLNMLANKAFAISFSFVIGQRFKDTLCGTKVLTKVEYERIASHRSYFGDFDPFGDFDLIFGAARRGLKIVEIPIHYKERTYGTTNISRWSHGVLLLRMLIFSALRLRCI